MKNLLLVLVLMASVSSVFAGELIVVLCDHPRVVATVYKGVSFEKVKDLWPTGDFRDITYRAVSDTARTQKTPWTLKKDWTATKVLLLGDSLSVDSTYVRRFGR